MLSNSQGLQRTHGTHKVPWVTLGLSVLVLIFSGMGEWVLNGLMFDKQAILNGEFWRILTGHFVHSNFAHLFWDVLALIILGSVIEMNEPKQLLPALFASCLAVSVWLFSPGAPVLIYCGLSGALNGLFAVSVFSQWKVTQNPLYLGVFGSGIAKMAYEFHTRKTMFVCSPCQSVPEAHLAGLIGGIFYLVIHYVLSRNFNKFHWNSQRIEAC